MPVLGKTQQELEFIQQELAEWALIVEIEIKKELKKRDIGQTGYLINSISWQIFKASAGNAGTYKLAFAEYGRMVDMGKGRLKRDNPLTNGEAYKRRGKKRKPQKWYGKTVYGMIYGRLLDQVTESWATHSANILKQTLTAP